MYSEEASSQLFLMPEYLSFVFPGSYTWPAIYPIAAGSSLELSLIAGAMWNSLA
jgi:hypothetical protein